MANEPVINGKNSVRVKFTSAFWELNWPPPKMKFFIWL
jgi:hypothetical protein